MQKPRLRKDGPYWRCWMPDAQDGHISETAREILVHTDNERGNEVRDYCGRVEEIVNQALELME
ncbi:hypothetical protein [Vreelandella venusta]|uniref:hypothetical protein n=1 Tax=Vreelandella venusta TaxID=44935 RepID=UPI003AA81683